MKIKVEFNEKNIKELLSVIKTLEGLVKIQMSYRPSGHSRPIDYLHPIQERILLLSKTEDIGLLKLREIGKKVGELHPQKIKHHIMQLKKKGYLDQ